MAIDPARHPCFDDSARHTFGRVHLPVAPTCNIKCKFCNRKYDCANETRPGVTSQVLPPAAAAAYLRRMVERKPNTAVAGIAGPGDPFANPAETMETLRLVRANHPEMLLCVASNGLGIGPYIEELAALETSHVTITVNAVDPAVGAGVYAWVRDGKTILRGEAGAARLLERQREAVDALKAHGITVKINFILIPGVNDHHVEAVAEEMAARGADLLNVMPLYPVEGTQFADTEPPAPESVAALRAAAAVHMPQMHHCTRCRADAAGLLGEDNAKEIALCLEESRAAAESGRPLIAVASEEGLLVNQHLGEAKRLWIFRRDGDSIVPIERRETPAAGGGNARWLELANHLSDCRAVLVSGVGPKPRSVLEQMGMRVVVMEGLIEDAARALYEGREIRAPRREFKCGQACSGGGGGCA